MGYAWILRDVDGTSYRYHHLDEFAFGLVVGSFVRKGQVIGTMGTTGNASAGPHLHFEVRRGGTTAVDPLPLLPVPRGVQVVRQPKC
jgi:murein DD-endopeptidase MepM/ murein hydrolase activator NlpD